MSTEQDTGAPERIWLRWSEGSLEAPIGQIAPREIFNVEYLRADSPAMKLKDRLAYAGARHRVAAVYDCPYYRTAEWMQFSDLAVLTCKEALAYLRANGLLEERDGLVRVLPLPTE